jgi:hypothetical protein
VLHTELSEALVYDCAQSAQLFPDIFTATESDLYNASQYPQPHSSSWLPVGSGSLDTTQTTQNTQPHYLCSPDDSNSTMQLSQKASVFGQATEHHVTVENDPIPPCVRCKLQRKKV